MFAYCLNNPVMFLDNNGFSADMLYYAAYGETSNILVLAEKKNNKNWIENPNKRKGSQDRQPSGARERNRGHKDGEEHSRKPKGNGMPIRHMQPNPAFAYVCVYYGDVNSANHTGNSIAVGFSPVMATYEYAFFEEPSFNGAYAVGIIGIGVAVILACFFSETNSLGF